MEKTVVLYPGFIVSHFVPMMRLAGVLIQHGYAVSVALIDPAVNLDDAFAAAVARAAASMPSVTFHMIPLVESPLTPGAHFILNYLDIIARHNERFHDFLMRSSSTRGVNAVVVDSISVEAFRVTRRLGIPGYVLFTSNAAALAAFVQLPSLHAQARTSCFKDLRRENAPLDFFGIPPMPASHLFGDIFDHPESDICKATVASLRGISEAHGILVNTFESLDAPAVAALGDPRCLPGRVMPPVYCVGPFVGAAQTSKHQQQHECLSWLDGQPDHSVVFLCFGSAGHNHSEEQLREIAVGLENSGHRFLWVLRAPFSDNPDTVNAVLPNGFLERTSGRGLVVNQWVPQADVIRHTATGVFVTHCGWNSVLEGVTAGVPMLCWPLYAEQKLNKLRMVGEMGIAAAEMVACQQGLVEAAEVERKVRLAMESEEGRELRTRVAAHKEAAAVAWDDGGPSRAAFLRFLSDVESRRQPRSARSGLAVGKGSDP